MPKVSYQYRELNGLIELLKSSSVWVGYEEINKKTYETIEASLNQGMKVKIEGGEFVCSFPEQAKGKPALLPFKESSSGEFSIRVSNLSASLMERGRVWMSNEPTAVAELWTQFDLARGRVLISGLGMGIVALLTAQKREVSEVVVYEQSQDVINIFNSQDYCSEKINIVNEPIEAASGNFDVVLLDHYNHEDNPISVVESLFNSAFAKNVSYDVMDFYGWGLSIKSYDEYIKYQKTFKLDSLSADDWKVRKESRMTKELSKALIEVSDSVNSPPWFEGAHIERVYKRARSRLISSHNGLLKSVSTTPAYAMYRAGDKDLLAIGLNWMVGSRSYSAKYSVELDKITDYYEIYSDGEFESVEINPKTNEVIATYSKNGEIKRDIKGDLLQKNHRVFDVGDIPTEVVNSFKNSNFPYLNRVDYWADKPYGRVVEFDISGLSNKSPVSYNRSNI